MVVFHNYLNCKCKIFIQNAELLAPVAQNWRNFFRRIIEMAENRRKQQKSMSFQLSSAPIRDDVSVADIMSGRYAENTDFLTHEADDFVIQMQARLENLQKIDFMERDRCFYKKQIIALQKDAEAAHKRMSLLQSQKDAMETRRDLLGDETIDEAALTERKEEIERLRKRIEQDETEAQKLEDKD